MSDKRREQRPGDAPLQEEELLTRLYQQTKDEAPPSHLDAAILAAARHAARPSSRRVSFLPSRKWAVPLSLAAALLVSIGVVRELRKDIAAPVLLAPSELLSSESMIRRKGLNREEKTLLYERETKGNQKTREGVETTEKFAPAAPNPYMAHMEPQSSGAPEEPGRTRGLASQALREESPVANMEKREALTTGQPEAPPASAARHDAQLLTAPVALDARLEGDKEDAPVETEAPPQLKKERSVSATSAPGNAPAAVEQKSQGRIDVVKDEILSPEAWIAKINKLRKTGQLSEAEKSLKKFKEKYPEYPVEKFLENP